MPVRHHPGRAVCHGHARKRRPAPAPPAETIVIQGLRGSLESALNAKRQDSGIVDVIKAEDIAKFPDTNLAESLQRVPGVVIDRDAGEGRNITVRGLGSDFTRVRINGVEALATTGGTDSSGGNNRSRGFDFNVFASELFNSITVRKSASADVDEGSLGATVDLQTSRPFDFKDFTATASVQGRYNDLAQSTDPRMAFLVSNTFADRKIGVLLSGAYSKRHMSSKKASAPCAGTTARRPAAGARRPASRRRTRARPPPPPAARRHRQCRASQARRTTSLPTTPPAPPATSTRGCHATAA